MREFTHKLKTEKEKDYKKLYHETQTTARKRTPKQNIKAHQDRKAAYLRKWTDYGRLAETQAQKDICDHIDCITRREDEMIAYYERKESESWQN